MPEIAEVALMSDAIRDIASGSKITKIEVLGGKYMPYHILDDDGNWINKVKNPKTGRLVSINPKKFPGGKYMVAMDGLDEISAEFPLTVNSVNVKGKYCWIDLGNNWFIGITFGMSGGIYYEPTEEVLSEYQEQTGKQVTMEEYMEHFHIKVTVDTGKCFYFGDARRFGSWTLSKDRKVLQKKLNKLGHDMLTHDPITDEEFIAAFRKYNTKNICKVLMDQEAVSGVGNYIKAEVLYACRINPWALVSDLDDQSLKELHVAVRDVALKAYKGHGATLYTYTGTRKEKGSFQNLLKVYGKPLDPHNHRVIVIPDKKAPDKRTTHYVKQIQTIGAHRDPDNLVSEPPKTSEPKIKIKKKIRLKSQITTNNYK
jgi:DNA-formamidopyrimidine glycosylase